MSSGSRVGWGYDAHALAHDPPLILGGLVASESLGVSATSDGDVLAHAVADAVLGAAALGDLGEHFPSSDPTFEGADSMEMLRSVVAMAADAGWSATSVDVTVIVENVRVSPHRDEIRARVADALGLSVDGVSVKATTTDGLGFVGRGEGIAVVAVVTMEGQT